MPMLQVSHDPAKNLFLIRGAFALNAQIKSLPARQWCAPLKAWSIPATAGAAGALIDAIGQPSRGDQFDPRFIDLYRQFKAGRAILTGQAGELEPPATRTKPFGHQILSYHLIGARDGCYLAWEMGTGKTLAVIQAIVGQDLKLCLVACPKSVVGNWPGQWAQHGDPRWQVLALGERPIAERARRLKTMLATGQRLVVVLNYEACWREPMAELLKAQQWDLVVCDEAHRIKEPKGRASMFFADLGHQARRRVALSGTPMPSSPMDLFGQLRFVDSGIFGVNFHSFQARYAIKGGFQNKAVVNFKDLEDLHQRFYSVAHRVTKEQVLELPEELHQTVHVTLGAEARALYTAIENDFVTEFRAGTISTENALTELIRLQQITGGAVKNDAGEMLEVDTAKADALQEILEDLDPSEPVVCFCRFHHDLDMIARAAAKAGRRSVELSGRRNEIGWKWQPGPATVAAVQIQAGGLGIDLTAARYCALYSLDFSNGDYEQALARLHRQGQRFNVTFLHLVATGTIDEKINAALERKEKVIQLILKDIAPAKELLPAG